MQGHAFANRFSRDWSLLKEEKECFRGYPGYQQEPPAVTASIMSEPR